MNTPKQPISEILQKPFASTKEELKTEFKAKIFEQIPVATIKLAFDKEVLPKDRIRVEVSYHANEVFKALWDKDTIELQESFHVLYFNNHNQVIGFYPHSKGAINGTAIDVRLILAVALTCGAVSMIIAHNHPSSNLKPSKADIKLTQKIQKASKIMEIKLLDHLIITKHDYYSFADEGEL